MAVALSALRGGSALFPGKNFWHLFLLEAESNPWAIVRWEGLGKLKKIQ
jgi:hypothetical protein